MCRSTTPAPSASMMWPASSEKIAAWFQYVYLRLSRPDEPARPLAPMREHEVPPSRIDHPLGRAESLHAFDRDSRSPRTRLFQEPHVSISADRRAVLS